MHEIKLTETIEIIDSYISNSTAYTLAIIWGKFHSMDDLRVHKIRWNQ